MQDKCLLVWISVLSGIPIEISLQIKNFIQFKYIGVDLPYRLALKTDRIKESNTKHIPINRYNIDFFAFINMKILYR